MEETKETIFFISSARTRRGPATDQRSVLTVERGDSRLSIALGVVRAAIDMARPTKVPVAQTTAGTRSNEGEAATIRRRVGIEVIGPFGHRSNSFRRRRRRRESERRNNRRSLRRGLSARTEVGINNYSGNWCETKGNKRYVSIRCGGQRPRTGNRSSRPHG